MFDKSKVNLSTKINIDKENQESTINGTKDQLYRNSSKINECKPGVRPVLEIINFFEKQLQKSNCKEDNVVQPSSLSCYHKKKLENICLTKLHHQQQGKLSDLGNTISDSYVKNEKTGEYELSDKGNQINLAIVFKDAFKHQQNKIPKIIEIYNMKNEQNSSSKIKPQKKESLLNINNFCDKKQEKY